jgi:hypothetical protein
LIESTAIVILRVSYEFSEAGDRLDLFERRLRFRNGAVQVRKTFSRFLYLILGILRKLFSSERFFSDLINCGVLIGNLFIEELYSVIYGVLFPFNFASDRFDLIKILGGLLSIGFEATNFLNCKFCDLWA